MDHFAIGTAASMPLPGTPTLFGFIDGEWWAAQVNATNDGFIVQRNGPRCRTLNTTP